MISESPVSRHTANGPENSTTPWLAGLDLSLFPGPTFDQQVAQAARYIRADILSPAATSDRSRTIDPSMEDYVPFTTKVGIDMSVLIPHADQTCSSWSMKLTVLESE